MVLLHSGKLLEYPNNPFAEEALIMRAEVQFNQQQMAEALASYKMLKEKSDQCRTPPACRNRHPALCLPAERRRRNDSRGYRGAG